VRSLLTLVLALIGLLTVLAIPSRIPAPAGEPPGRPFAWGQDSVWQNLEAEFRQVRDAGCELFKAEVAEEFARLETLIVLLSSESVAADDGRWQLLERTLFRVAPIAAACPEYGPRLSYAYSRVRRTVKIQSRGWNPNEVEAKQTLYRLLYGGRAAIEEVWLQSAKTGQEILAGVNEPSAAPSAVVRGVQVHSGDILVSRGGAPTSALIARGNDFPGNFSHIALVHVDDASGDVSIIEAHIEVGVAVSDIETYFRDRKLRVMLLRPRADLPALREDPSLPHRAASAVLDRV
jgi:hypothetical protein